MNTAIAAPLARARKLAYGSSVVAIIAAIALIASAVADVAAPALRALGGLSPGWEGTVELIKIIGGRMLLAAPIFLIAGVCVDLRRVLLEYAGGRFFTHRASAGVRKAGEGVLWAMAFKCVLSPWLYSIIIDGVRGGPPSLRLEPFDLGLISLGFFIMVMGRLLQAAAALKAENDQIV
jgi:hypothetical protein